MRASYTKRERFQGQHRFEHWYRDNAVYFITSRTRDGYLAFLTPRTHEIFWDRFNFYTSKHGFTPWVTSLIGNHNHTLGYLRKGNELGEMMRFTDRSRSGSTMNFRFVIARNGCIRNELQARRAYRYTLTRCTRHRLGNNWRSHPNTRMNADVEPAIRRARNWMRFSKQFRMRNISDKPLVLRLARVLAPRALC